MGRNKDAAPARPRKPSARELTATLARVEHGRDLFASALALAVDANVFASMTLEQARTLQDMCNRAVIAASTLRIRTERRIGELPKGGAQ